MRYLIVTVICYFILSGVSAQKCERPKEVFIKLNSLDSVIKDSGWFKIETPFYLLDSREGFFRLSEVENIEEKEYNEIHFNSVYELRNEARKIRRCEIKRAGETIYLDVDINSIYKNIYMISRTDTLVYKFKVRWLDGIE